MSSALALYALPDELVRMIVDKLPRYHRRGTACTCKRFFLMFLTHCTFPSDAFHRALRLGLLPAHLPEMRLSGPADIDVATDLATFRAITLSFERASADRAMLACLNAPSVTRVSATTVVAVPADADFDVVEAALSHPKLVTCLTTAELVGDGDRDIPKEHLGAIQRFAERAFITVLRPLTVQHLREIVPLADVVHVELFPMGASPDVEAAATSIAAMNQLVRKSGVKITYRTVADTRILVALLRHHGHRNVPCDLEICADAECDAECGECLQDVMTALFHPTFCWNRKIFVAVGPEVAHPEPLFRAIQRGFNTSSANRIRLKCCTPTACDDVRSLLQLFPTYMPELEIITSAFPAQQGQGKSDAWAWDAMEHATLLRMGDVVIYGACLDLGLPTHTDEGREQARRAGAAMGRAGIAINLAVMFRSADAGWMAPFVRGYLATCARGVEHTVTLCAGKTNGDAYSDKGTRIAVAGTENARGAAFECFGP